MHKGEGDRLDDRQDQELTTRLGNMEAITKGTKILSLVRLAYVSFAIGSDSTETSKELMMPQRKQAVAGGNFREEC